MPGEFAAAAACATVGLLLSILPHLMWWPVLGRPTWFRTRDDLFYLSVLGWAYHDHPASTNDPILDAGAIYPWLPTVPAILCARGLGLGPLGVYTIWRAVAGLGLGSGWYLIIRYHFRRRWVAACLAVILLCDIGLCHNWEEVFPRPGIATYTTFSSPGSHLFKHVLKSLDLICHRRVGASIANSQFRVFSPGVIQVSLLLYLWLLARARDLPTRPRLAGAGLGFGLLFYAYFYYWTTAALGLLLAMALDAGHRRTYVHIGWIGALVGLPSVIAGYLFKRSVPIDGLQRMDWFLPIPRFSELLIPQVPIILAVLGFFWAWFRRRDLIPLWAFATAGLLLLNHQVLTGLQTQNDHWRKAFDPAFALLLLLIAARGLLNRRPLPKGVAPALLAVSALFLGTGLWFRALEARLPNPLADYRKYRAQRLARGPRALRPRSVVAGEPMFVHLASILDDQRPLYNFAAAASPSVTNGELDLRCALDAYLRGLDRARFEREQGGESGEAALGVLRGPRARDPRLRAEILARRLAAFERIAADPRDALGRLGGRYVALPPDQPPPAYLKSGWRRLEAGPYWQVWEYQH